MVSIERHFAVAVDHFVALLDKFKAHITAMFDNVVFLRHGDVAHQCQLDHNSVHLIFFTVTKVHRKCTSELIAIECFHQVPFCPAFAKAMAGEADEEGLRDVIPEG